MVVVEDGRYELPDNYQYMKNQHIYIDKTDGKVGIDEIGYAFLNQPKEITFLVDKQLEVGKPFCTITTDQGITTLNAPCSGNIEKLNVKALEYMDYDTYNKGYLVRVSNISDLSPFLIKQSELNEWAEEEAKSLTRNKYSFKVVEVGDSAVGKTAIKVRFTDDYFKKDLKTTLGVDFGSKEIKGEYLGGDILFKGTYRFTAKINVWDAAGQTHYEKIRHIYYRDAKGAIMVYDINNPISFQNLDKWIKELEQSVGLNIPVLLVGNKLDLERKVPRQDGLQFAMEHNFMFIECSAKTGEKVDEAFYKLALEIFKREEGLE